jgi:hypothetical protein
MADTQAQALKAGRRPSESEHYKLDGSIYDGMEASIYTGTARDGATVAHCPSYASALELLNDANRGRPPASEDDVERLTRVLTQACREYPAQAKVVFGWAQAEYLARAAIAALSQPAPKEAVADRGWLIEENFGPVIHYIGLQDPHDHWRKLSEDGRNTNGRSALVGIIRFCKDANDAIRFARAQDAQQLVDALGRLLTEPRICEHEWPVSTEPAPTIQPSAEGLAGEQVHGVTREPTYGEWCRNPALCAGKGYCPRDPSCGD